MKPKKLNQYIISSAVVTILFSGCFGDNEEKQNTQTKAQDNIKTTQEAQVEPQKVEEVEKIVETSAEKIEKTPTQTTQEVQIQDKEDAQVTQAQQLDGQKLYAKCISCHGTNGEKIALGKSKIIKDMSNGDFISALIGYQNGTYGGSMKGLMATQVKAYTNEEIEAIANYIVK